MKIQQTPHALVPLRKLPTPALAPEEAARPSETRDEAPKLEPDKKPPNTRQVRIGRFVQNLTLESLEHLRYLSTILAFNMAGTTLGLLAATPIGIHYAHDNAAVVGGVAIGGGVAAGGVAALAGYALEHKTGKPKRGEEESRTAKVAAATLTLASGLRALPQFIYPTVVGGTAVQEKAIYDALDKLPLKDVTASATMHVIPNLTDTGISGMSQPGLTHTRILLDSDYLNDWRAEGLVHHEQGHAVDYSGGYGLLGPLNWRGPFGQAPFVTSYASGNRYEDWAESFEAYHHDPDKFRLEFPDKARVIEQHEIPTTSDRLMDREPVRRVGRTVGHALGQVPLARTALETGLAMLSPIQLHRGARALEKGLVTGDEALKLRGKMNLISGVLLGLPGGAPFATVASAMNLGFQVSVGDDPGKLAEANRTADRFMAVATGPVGMASVAIGQELRKAGVDLSQLDYTVNVDPNTVSGGAMLKGLLCTVGGAVAGSLLGVAIGGAFSGVAGASLSSFWGRIGGAMVGLGAYGAYRVRKQEQAEPSPYDLTRGDKIFLSKIVGGAATGAALGTAAGVMGGRAVGALVGNALFGPGSDSWSAGLGGWAGALIGSYTLGKAGAVVGRRLTEKGPTE